MGVLKCFSGLKLGAYIWHRFGFKSFAFVNSSVQEICFCFGYFSRELNSLMVFASLFNELYNLQFGCAPEGEDVINESFPAERF